MLFVFRCSLLLFECSLFNEALGFNNTTVAVDTAVSTGGVSNGDVSNGDVSESVSDGGVSEGVCCSLVPAFHPGGTANSRDSCLLDFVAEGGRDGGVSVANLIKVSKR